MAILQQTNAVFYHPLDDLTESLQAQAWAGPSDFQTAKVSLGLKAVAGDAVDSFGAESVFNAANMDRNFVITLSPTQIVVVYRDVDNGNFGTAIVGTVSGAAITFGAEAVFNAANSIDMSVATLSPTKVVVTFSEKAIVGTVSGTAITFGAVSSFNIGSTDSVSTATLSPTKVVVAYRDGGNGNFGTAVVGTVTGTTVTFGAEAVFNAASSGAVSAAPLSPTKVVVAYRDQGNANFGTAVVGTVAGTTVTFGAESVFNIGFTDATSTAALSPTQFVVTYQDNDNSGVGTAIVGTVAGTTIAFGAEAVFNAALGNGMVVALSPTKVVVAHSDGGNGNFGTAIVGTVTGAAITFGAEAVFKAALVGAVRVTAISPTQFVVAYQGSGNFGTAIVGSLALSASSLTGIGATYTSAVAATRLAFSTWTRSPGSPAPFTGPPAQFFEETDRNMMIAMGMPASRLGGFT